MRKRKQAKSNKISKFGVWEWDDWTRDIPTLICDPIDDKGMYFAELIPSWPNDVNDRGEYEWDGSFDPETETTNWTLEIYDSEFGEGGWTEVYGTAREAMEEADDFIAEFITEQNLIGNGPYTLARRNAMRKRRKATRRKVAQFNLSDLIEGHYYENYWGYPVFYNGIKHVSPYYEELDARIDDDLYEFVGINKNGEPVGCYNYVHDDQDWWVKREISLNEALELYKRKRLELEEDYAREMNAASRSVRSGALKLEYDEDSDTYFVISDNEWYIVTFFEEGGEDSWAWATWDEWGYEDGYLETVGYVDGSDGFSILDEAMLDFQNNSRCAPYFSDVVLSYLNTSQKKNMRKRAYNYWESMEFNGDEAVEFQDIIPINVYEGKSEYIDGGYVFNGELYTDDVTWDEYDENESYTWGFLIVEDSSYEWDDYSGTFTGTEWEAQDWADGLIQKFIDDYEAGLIAPQGMDYYSQYFD